MPLIPFGKYRISRLIAGGNTVNGGSHLSPLVNFAMKEYFTGDQTQDFFNHCREEGVNTFQAGFGNLKAVERFRQSGKELNLISLISSVDSEKRGITFEMCVQKNIMGLAHHGEVTDSLFKQGKIDQVQDFLKKIRDSGIQVGLSTHMPAVVEYVEEKGWDLDFYMTCVYERHRSKEELHALLGRVPIPVREVYLEEDPPRMYEMIQATKKTCLAFKILAAGRRANNSKQVVEAFRSTFANIKSIDAVIVGMFPRWTDQVKENADLVKQHGV
jgi:hypothetical protein